MHTLISIVYLVDKILLYHQNKFILSQKCIDVNIGGAGVSTESQIPDFRSSNGLYQLEYHYPPEQVVSHSFFVRHTEEFYQFYKERMMFLDAKPNAAHRKLAELEQAGKLKAVITQNIDGLHQQEASRCWSFMEVFTEITVSAVMHFTTERM